MVRPGVRDEKIPPNAPGCFAVPPETEHRHQVGLGPYRVAIFTAMRGMPSFQRRFDLHQVLDNGPVGQQDRESGPAIDKPK